MKCPEGSSGPFTRTSYHPNLRVRFYTPRPHDSVCKNSPRIFVVVRAWVSKHKDFRFSLALRLAESAGLRSFRLLGRAIISF